MSCCCYMLFFFFSSRRRHTRYIGDWSSEVCSSDLRLHSFIKLHHTADCTFLQVREILFAKFGAAQGVVTNVIVFQAAQLNTAYFSGNRSEERRVGKECRSRWSP